MGKSLFIQTALNRALQLLLVDVFLLEIVPRPPMAQTYISISKYIAHIKVCSRSVPRMTIRCCQFLFFITSHPGFDYSCVLSADQPDTVEWSDCTRLNTQIWSC